MPRFEDIPIGAGNAITRAELAELWGMDDRTARDTIARLRSEDNGDGYVIVSSSHSAGYYRTNDIDDITRFCNECMHRSDMCKMSAKKARRIIYSKMEVVN